LPGLQELWIEVEALELSSGMNWKLLISAVLLLVLIPVSAFGLACDVRCGLEGIAVDHSHLSHAHSGDSNASASMDMPPTHCHSMQHALRANSSQALASCELTSQTCGQGHCASEPSWLAGQRSSNNQLVVSPASPLEMAMSASSAAPIPSLASQLSLPLLVHRRLAVLRI
jgi:hypothetical protein